MFRWRIGFAMLVLLGCLTFTATASATNVSGTIASNTIWTTGGSPYVMTGNVNVSSGVTLTIQAGVTVQGNATTRTLTINGALSAVGTSGSPIVFTSTTDSASGQWTGITFTSTASASSLSFVNMRYGGGAGASDGNGMLSISGGAITIEDSTFSNSAVSGIMISGGLTGSAASLVMRRSKSEANGFIGAARHGSGLYATNGQVTIEDSAFWSNATDGVRFGIGSSYAGAAAQLSGSSFWSNTRWGVYIPNVSGGTLSLAPDGNVSGKPPNDVYDNGTFGLTTTEDWNQFDITFPTTAADWTGTYWGPTTMQPCAYGSTSGHLSYGAPDPSVATSLPVDRGPVTHHLATSGANWCGNDDVAVDPPATTEPSLYFDPPPATFGGLLGPQTYGCLECLKHQLEVAATLDAQAGAPVRHVDQPVETATGSLTESTTDLELPGPGIPFGWTRSYNSQDTYSSALGTGWTHPFMASLTVVNPTTGQLEYRSGSGQRTQLVKTSGGGTGVATYAGKGFDGKAERLSGGTYQITTRDQRVLSFDSGGLLTQIKPRFLPATTLTYTTGKLTSITDAAGRAVAISYSVGTPTLIDRVTLPDGRYVQYGYTTGRLTSIRDARGKTWTLAYNGAGYLQSILDPTGNYQLQSVTYDGSGRVTSEADGAGSATSYAYSTVSPYDVTTVTPPGRGSTVYRHRLNMLFSITDPQSRTTTYTYDSMGRMATATDGRGKTTRYTSDARGNLTKQVGPAPSSVTTSRTFNATNDVTSETDGRGNAMTYTYATGADPAADYQVGQVKSVTDREAGVTTFKYWTSTSSPTPATPVIGLKKSAQNARLKTTLLDYDSSGNLTKTTSPLGFKTTYTFDASGRILSMRDARGNVPVTPAGYRTQWTYDENDHVLTQTDPRGNVATSTYLDNGLLATTVRTDVGAVTRTTMFAYDSANRLWKTTMPAGGITVRLYSSDGLLASVESATHDVESYGYDNAGQLTTKVEANGNAAGATASDYTWTYTYDGSGNQITAAHPDGGTSQVAYDELNRPNLWTDPLSHTKSVVYDADSNVTSRTDGLTQVVSATFDKENRPLTMKDGNGQTSGLSTVNTYWPTGELKSSTTPLGNKTTYTLDDDGRTATMVEPRGNVGGGTPSNYTWTYGYDEVGNRTSVTDPLSHVVQYTWDEINNPTSVVDQNANTTSFAYDVLDRIDTVTPPAAGATGTLTTSYDYDADSNLSSRTDPNAHATTWTYNTDERLDHEISPIGRTNYLYYPNGTTKTVETPAGTATGTVGDGTITYGYDRMSRQTSVAYSDATPGVTRTYDTASRPATMVDQAGTATYTFDNADRLTDIVRSGGVSGINGTLHYGYDASDNITGRTLPDGTAITIGFDSDNRPTTHTAASATTTVGYDEAGNITSVALPAGNGYTETRTFDRAGRLTTVDNAKSGTSLSKYTWGLDNVGSPIKVTTLRGATTAYDVYGYDTRNRITNACYGVSSGTTTCTGATTAITYAYDKVDNRSSEVRAGSLPNTGTITSSYNAADQLISTSNGSTTNYTYDTSGNQATAGATTFTYDLANRQTGATTGGVATTYTYDGDNNRVQSTTSGGTDLRYTWDPLAETGVPEIATERAPSTGNLIRRYLTTPLGAASMTTASATFYYHQDPRGTVTDLTNASGTAQWLYEYDPYGAARTTSNVSGSAPENRIGFNAQYLDPETGLYHLRARLYNPNTGLFGAVDPVGGTTTGASTGTYGYANANPLLYTDPLGLWPGLDFNPLDVAKNVASAAANATTSAVSTVTTAAVDGGTWVYEHPAEAGLGAATILSFAPVPWVSIPARLILAANVAYNTGNAGRTGGLGAAAQTAGLGMLDLMPGGKGGKLAAKIAERCPGAARALKALGFGGGRAAEAGTDVVKYDADFALSHLTRSGSGAASDLVRFGESQGWARLQTAGGPIKFIDDNGVVRLTIKRGSTRAPGSNFPHVEVRNAAGQRVDPYGNEVTRRSAGNHSPMDWDLP